MHAWCKTGRGTYIHAHLHIGFFEPYITSERKDLLKIHELKTKRSLRQTPTYLIFSLETTDVADRVVTDRHTHTQDKYCNPPAHARRG